MANPRVYPDSRHERFNDPLFFTQLSLGSPDRNQGK